MAARDLSLSEKRRQAALVGNQLVKNYGKKRYYTPLEIRNANRQAGVSIDYVCWSYALFSCLEDFNLVHQKLGESCDYASMKSEMLTSVGSAFDPSSVNIDASWLEISSVDFSVFDFFDPS